MMGAVFAQGAKWIHADREFEYIGDDNFYNSNYVDVLEKPEILQPKEQAA
ncbi:hypothetical protein [Pseudomonas aeruginosa]|nr:hypothetical protein [Pseudomonas aeruginosa]GLE62575.1 hypothetical protein VNPA110516_27560 [Pseudomonas aeruginosa]GLE75241.1 hypothetical protein VNPA120641_21070 [Pseudomonas aeruginosa]GLE88531.1 hypothetical protein VNPA120719_19200 [Pseudomonas aeruginosa]